MHWMITGANRGIGLEYVKQLLARGDEVFAMCRQPASASDLQELKSRYSDKLSIVALEITDPESVASAYATVSSQTDSLDVIVNNAAINTGEDTIETATKDNLLKCFEVNVVGTMLVSQRFMALLKNGNQPRLVNIGSGAGSIADGAPPMYCSYNISKTGLNMLNMMLHQIMHPQGMISTVLNPGWVITDMGGENADMQPEESVKHQLVVIDTLTLDDSGRFKNYDGSEIAW